jgi:Flp pilus assembly protein TadD
MRFNRPSFGPLVAAALCVGMAGCAATEDVSGSDVAGSTRSVETLIRMGDYTLARGDEMTAIAFYQRAHAQEPETLAPLLRLGAALARAGDYERSADAFEAALVIDPLNADAQRGLGNALVAMGQPEEALPHFETALSVSEDHRAYNSTGVALDLLGRHQDARFYYREGLERVPGNLSLLSNLALSLSLSGDHEEAVAVAREVASMPRAGDRQRLNLAMILSLAGRTGDAERVALRVLPEEEAQQRLQYWAQLRQIPDSAARAAAIGGAGAPAIGS